MFNPLVTHLPCDLNQQKKREEARRDSAARAIERRRGKRFLLDRILRRGPVAAEVTAEDLRQRQVEDVFHGFRF